jgi:hypothetical protein
VSDSPDDNELDRLLARGGLGGARRERVLDRLLADRRRARRRRRWLLVAPPLLAAAAALVLYLRPAGDGFHSRGDGGGPLVDVGCRDGAADRCPSGGTLVFRVDGAARGGYLVAWAEQAPGAWDIHARVVERAEGGDDVSAPIIRRLVVTP